PVKQVAGYFKVECDTCRNGCAVMFNDKGKQLQSPFFVGIKGTVDQLDCLCAAVCQLQNPCFCLCQVKETHTAAAAGKAESTGIWSASDCFQIGGTALQLGKVLVCVRVKRLFMGLIRRVPDNHRFIPITQPGNSVDSVLMKQPLQQYGKRLLS